MVRACFVTPSCRFKTFEPYLEKIDMYQERNLSLQANKRDSATEIEIQTFFVKRWILSRADSFDFNQSLHPIGTVTRNSTGKVVQAQLRVRTINEDKKHIFLKKTAGIKQLAQLIKVKEQVFKDRMTGSKILTTEGAIQIAGPASFLIFFLSPLLVFILICQFCHPRYSPQKVQSKLKGQLFLIFFSPLSCVHFNLSVLSSKILTTEGAIQIAGPASGEVLERPVQDQKESAVTWQQKICQEIQALKARTNLSPSDQLFVAI